MASVGIFVGSSGGVTQEAAEKLEELFDGAELINMEEDYDDLDQFDEFDVLLQVLRACRSQQSSHQDAEQSRYDHPQRQIDGGHL